MNRIRPADHAPPLAAETGQPHTDPAGGCDPFPSLGQIGLLIIATATQNLALTGRPTARGRDRQTQGATAPRSQ
ncbi:hypothetical protein OG302_39215 [Streptomyces sp. NBC_01283]|uniref:hypothetical protein n=1 Tax=Streptomyces sp. NBC_01283 TaxID=2903812 RepID=UPI00352EDB6C|nr:hypothetical protein OG302_39215 [Streptomyces sp. NBC_01283]